MNSNGPGGAVAAGFGVGFILGGIALLLQEFDMLTLRWSYVLPVVLVATGLVVLLTGLVGAHRARANRLVAQPPG